jgi:hypothetical protein
MSNFPPLPRYLTLEEAAQAMTDRTGKQWTPRQILGCAERHEITIFARISHAVKFVRVRPIEGRTNEIAADKGSLPILETEAIRALLLAGEAHSTGWEEPATVDFFGEPVEAWQKVFELAPGEDAPLVRPDGCRVTAAGILQLVDTHTTPVQAEPQAVQVMDARAKPRTWWDVSSAYIVEVMQAGQYATAKELYRALEAKAGPNAPFDKGTGANRGSLFVREIAQPLSVKTVQNNWPALRELAKK